MNSSPHVESVVRAHLSVAEMALKNGDYRAAFRNLNEALDEVEVRPVRMSHADLAYLSRVAGKVYTALGHYADAERAFESAIEAESESGALTDECRDARHLAECYRMREKYSQAEEMYKKCISRLTKRGSELLVAKCSLGLAQVYLDQKKFAQADETLKAARDLFEQTVGRRSFWYGRALMTYARLLYLRGELERSEESLREGLAIIEPHIGPFHPLRETMLKRLAKVMELKGDKNTADQLFAEAEEIDKHLRQFDV